MSERPNSSDLAEKDARLLRLAQSVADGEEVDWEKEIRSISNSEDLQTIGRLRALSSLSRFHRHRIGDAFMIPRPAALAVLSRWSGLEIRKKLGEGSFAEVFLAWDPKLEREVALKLLRIGDGEASDRVAAMLREARLFARLRHSNVATVYGAESFEGRAGFWMERIRGKSLEELLDGGGAFGAREAALIGVEICHALAAVHGAGLVHRDVKAANVIREEGGRIVLADFGATRERDLGAPGGNAGTPLYMAPELFRREPANAQTDLYSLGVLLYRLVSKAYPIEAADLKSLVEAHERGERSLLRDRRPDLPEPFIRATERALEPDLAKRFRSAGEFERALLESVGGGVAASPVSPARRSGAGIWVGLGLAVVAGGAALFWDRGEDPKQETEARTTPPNPRENLEREQSKPAEPLAQKSEPAEKKPQTPEKGIEAPQKKDDAPTKAEELAPKKEEATIKVESAPLKKEEPAPKPAPPLMASARFCKIENEVRETLGARARVLPGERIGLGVDASESVFVYAFAFDEGGCAYPLFPWPNSNDSNPLSPDQAKTFGNASWQVMGEGKAERVLLVLSRKLHPELQAEAADLARQKNLRGFEKNARDEEAIARRLAARKRAEPVLPADGVLRSLARSAELLSGRCGNHEGLWIAILDLEVPRRK